MINPTDFLTNPKYTKIISWINDARDHSWTWEKIKYAGKENRDGLESFLEKQSDENFWDIDSDCWFVLVEKMEQASNGTFESGFVSDPKVDLKAAPINPTSCWVHYKKLLSDNGFSFESIHGIENSVTHIISQLEEQTEQNKPVRGLVLGNVQSGKTANMAGLISMAADYGYNFFIVLTGTIDSLRIQTRKRLCNDLDQTGTNVHFQILDDLDVRTPQPYRLMDLHLNEGDNFYYLNVCLKNSTRLDNLLKWMNSYPEKKSKLKILLIDDEADQAGINTAHIDRNEITRINGLIKKIVFGGCSNGSSAVKYKAMNYIGYTATPYANFLNEANENALYPCNFICCLNSPGEYFGPQRIFGLEGYNTGLPIVNIISQDDVDAIADLTQYGRIPNSLEEAILWFMCTVACFRYWELKKPVSMLIHTSQKISKHNEMAKAIEDYFSNIKSFNSLFAKIVSTYKKQTKSLSIERFFEEVPDFPNKESIKEYPNIDLLKPFLQELYEEKIQHIQITENGELSYSRGLHLCVDNSARTYMPDQDCVVRIVYPDHDKKSALEISPAFIVVGGSTLSRGLTLEGLTVSYFLRTTNTADTLMQMGRWFGYRNKYELLPRLWISQKSNTLFQMLSKLDFDLREEIHNMECLGRSPREYGPRIDDFSDYQRLIKLRVSANNRIQSAIKVTYNYANKKGQTTKVYNQKEKLENNFKNTIDFINKLGPIKDNEIEKLQNKFAEKSSSLVWLNIEYRFVLEYLLSLEYPEQSATFNDKEIARKWFDSQYENGYLNGFTVVVNNLKTSKTKCNLKHVSINLPTRRKLTAQSNEKFIKLKTILAPSDRFLDVDMSKLNEQQKEDLVNFAEQENKGKISISEKRIECGLVNTPILIIYIIDKDSGENEKDNDEWCALKAPQHVVGYYLHVPYGNNGNKKDGENENKLTVDLDFPEELVEDINDENGD